MGDGVKGEILLTAQVPPSLHPPGGCPDTPSIHRSVRVRDPSNCHTPLVLISTQDSKIQNSLMTSVR